MDEIRKFSAIYGRFDCKRKPEKPLTLHEVSLHLSSQHILQMLEVKVKVKVPLKTLSMTHSQVSVNEAAAQICRLAPAMLTRRDELFPLARQVLLPSYVSIPWKVSRFSKLEIFQLLCIFSGCEGLWLPVQQRPFTFPRPSFLVPSPAIFNYIFFFTSGV